MKLLNKDVYNTAEEAQKAFEIFCKDCEECPLSGKDACTIAWLYLEYDVDAPETKENASVIAMREKIEDIATRIFMKEGDVPALECVDWAITVYREINKAISKRESEIKELANGSH